MKRPSFQFYPSDWRADTGLQICSLQARGLWVEILCLMHEIGQREGGRYGYLEMNGKRLTGAQIARLVGIDEKQVLHLMDELQEAGVFSRGEDAVIYSRRLLRDGELKQTRSKAGSKGGSKTQSLIKQKQKQKPSKGAREGAPAEDEDEEEVKKRRNKESKERKKEEAAILASYHDLCPSLPKVRRLTEARRKSMGARQREGVDFKELFTKAEASDFLTGRIGEFKADFGWLLLPDNCVKTLEGKYDNRTSKPKKDRDYANALG
jgi:ethanolamine utilization protein EutQ (cupin superfamily)